MSTRIGIAALLAAIATLLFTAPNAGADTIVGKEGPSAQYSGCEDHAIDPVGVLFRGLRAGVSNVSRSIIFETGDDDDGWHYTENYAPQGLKIHQPDGSYDCKYTDGANASASGKWANSRTHVRLWFVDGSADENPAPNEVKTVGTPHHEDFVVSVDPQIPGIDLGALGFGTNLGCKGLPVSLDLPTPFGWISVNGNHAVDEGGHINQNKDSGFDRGRHELRQAFENKHEIKAEDWGNTEEIHQCDDDYAGSDGNGVTIYIKRAMYPKTAQASNIYTNTSTLNGFLDTDEPTTSYWFAYGTNPSQGAGGYPNETSATMIAGSASIDVSKAISGLTPNTTYYVRLFAENQDGEVEEGNEVSFSTCYTGSFNSDEEASGPRPIVDCDKIVHVFYRTPKGGLGHRWMAPTDTSWGSDTLGGSVAGEPEAVVDKDGGINVFYRTPKGTLGHDWWEAGGTKWGSEDLGGAVATDPHAIVDKDKVVHVFYRTPNNGIGHRWMAPTDTSWGSDSLGGPIAGEPIAVVDRDGGINVFFRKFGGTLGHDWWEVGGANSGHWNTEDLGGSVAADPHAIVDKDKVVHVFYRTPNNGIGHRWMAPTDTSWGSDSLGGPIAGEPIAVVDRDGGINVFFRKFGGTLGHDWWEVGGTKWGSEDLGGAVATDPHAIVDKDKVVHVFYRTPNNGIGHRWMAPTDTSWGSDSLSGPIAGEPIAVVDRDGGINVFFRKFGGTLGHDWWEVGGTKWGSEDLGGAVGSGCAGSSQTDTRIGPRPRAVVDCDKTVHVFYRTPSGTLGHRWMAPTDTSWNSNTLGGALAGEPEAEVDKDGGINVFFRTTTGTLGHDWLEAGSNTWGTENLGGSVAADPHAIVDKDKVVHVFYRTPSGTLGHRWMAPTDTSWGSDTLGGSVAGEPEAEVDKDGGINVFFRTTTGTLGHDWLEAGSNTWGTENLGGSVAADPHAIVDKDKVVHVFYRTPSGTLGHRWMAPTDTSWGSDTLGGSVAGEPEAEVDKDGGINVFFRTTTGTLGHDWWEVGGNTWGTENLGGSVAADPHAIVDKDKVVHVFYRTPSGTLGHRWMAPTDTSWGSDTLGGALAGEPEAEVDKDGGINVFFRTTTGTLGHDWWEVGGANSGKWGTENLGGSVAGPLPRYRYVLGTSAGSSFTWGATSLITMAQPQAMAIKDVTGDGKADVVSAEVEGSGSTYRYMLGSSATSYFGWSGTSLVGMTQPAMMALGDVTGDGKADIVATEKQASGQYNYKLGISSSSNFTWYSTNLNGMSEPTQLALGDVTGDGKADIVATEKQPDGYYRYMLGVSGGSTTFTWGFTSLSGMSQPQKLALGDINNDGKGDIVAVENEAGGKARYIYATSSGSNFNSPKVSNLIGMTPPTKIAVGDVNKDGRADIVGAEPEGNGRYRYMLGSSSGSSFAWTATSMVSMGEPFRMSVADVTGDGKADVVGVEPQYAG